MSVETITQQLDLLWSEIESDRVRLMDADSFIGWHEAQRKAFHRVMRKIVVLKVPSPPRPPMTKPVRGWVQYIDLHDTDAYITVHLDASDVDGPPIECIVVPIDDASVREMAATIWKATTSPNVSLGEIESGLRAALGLEGET